MSWRRINRRFGGHSRHPAGLAQLVEHPPCKREVAGSIPAAGTNNLNALAQLFSFSSRARGSLGTLWARKNVGGLPERPRIALSQSLCVDTINHAPVNLSTEYGLRSGERLHLFDDAFFDFAFVLNAENCRRGVKDLCI
jgi:hypothetical protein